MASTVTDTFCLVMCGVIALGIPVDVNIDLSNPAVEADS